MGFGNRAPTVARQRLATRSNHDRSESNAVLYSGMNRSQRRAAVAQAKTDGRSAPIDADALMAQATLAYQERRFEQAEVICKQILVRCTAYKAGLNLLGIISQESGRHRLAVKRFAAAIASDELYAVCHYNIGCSYQALGERTQAGAHFRKAIALGMGDEKTVEEYVMQNPVIVRCIERMSNSTQIGIKHERPFDDRDIAVIANDVFLCCALELTILRGLGLELFLTNLRLALLTIANANLSAPDKVDEEVIGLFCALAQQCFNNEYVFSQSEAETQQADRLRDELLVKLAVSDRISPLLLAAVAAYFPLHSLAGAEALLTSHREAHASNLLIRQIREPLEERDDRRAIPALTTIEDATSLRVKEQYEENPYPRWTIDRLAVLTDDMKRQLGAAHSGETGPSRDILVAGCGSGQHSIQIAQYCPDARILAVDISLASLAYARRKTRERRLQNIEYAQADVLQLEGLGRTFDRIDAVGVLHHLADPLTGWRILLSLLQPSGIMRVGLYSDIARRPIVEAHTLIAECGYRATTEDISAFRQMVIRNNGRRFGMLVNQGDFYSMSGCRDLLFHVMEHRFTIQKIASFVREHELSFLGFELDGKTTEKFRRQYSDDEALTNLDRWDEFEAANPQTFRGMYIFSVRKNARDRCRSEYSALTIECNQGL
jgi:2-polyprenyl-3-methyl-5-hydroxy-6-metoxy-1,4-benzoquinol methylase